MYPPNKPLPLRILLFLVSALALSSCVYRPVVVDNYSDASSYAELFSSSEGNAKLQSALDRNNIRVMRAGEQVPDWNERGLDVDRVLNEAPGGRDDNVLMYGAADTVTFSSDRSFQELFRPGYTIYPILGTETMFESGHDELSVFGLIKVGEHLWVESLTRKEKRGNASCVSRDAIALRLLTTRPYASLTKLEKSFLAALNAAAGRNDPTICQIAEADGEARWRMRFFLPDGRRLPVFDGRIKSFTIVPRDEVKRLIAGS